MNHKTLTPEEIHKLATDPIPIPCFIKSSYAVGNKVGNSMSLANSSNDMFEEIKKKIAE